MPTESFPWSAIVAIIIAVAGATKWVVSAVNGVKTAIIEQGAKHEVRFNDHEKRISELEDEVWPD